MFARPRLSFALAAAAAAAIWAGCGGDDGAGGDPAALVPAGTPVYIEGSIRPEGDLRTDTEAAIATVSGFEDPGTRLVDLIDQGLAEDTDLTYEEDIEPWLGERGAVAVTSFTDDEAFALMVETTDSGAAEDFLAEVAETEPDVREESYEGSDYRVDRDGFSIGIVDDLLVGAPEPIFKQLVDASGGDSLADDSTFEETLGAAPEGSLVDVYVGIEDAIRAAGDEVDSAGLQAIESTLGDLSGKTALASVIPSGDQVELEISTNIEVPFEPADVSGLLESLPAESWGAFGIADLGAAIAQGLEQAEAAGLPRGLLESQLGEVGIDLQRDILDWPDDFALFVGGTDLSSLAGAAIITSKDPAASTRAVEKLVSAALAQGEPGVRRLRVPGGAGLEARDPEELGPKPLQLIARGDRVVLGYGAEATRRALRGGGQTLAGSAAYERATEALGAGVELSGFLSIGPILDLAESLGAADDIEFAEARPYLERLSYLVFGSGTEGGLALSRIVIGLQSG
jgi:Protein of unknown function (DUF3352)